MIDRTRRQFLSAVGGTAIGAALAPKFRAGTAAGVLDAVDPDQSAQSAARDEKFWAAIRQGFDLPKEVLNLDNGYCNPLSRAVADDLVRSARYIQDLPAKRLTEVFTDVTKPRTMSGVARILGVPAEEIGLVRNATEALDTVILGLPLSAGDEIVCSSHDYYAMLDAIEQRRTRDGIVVRMIEPPFPAASMDALVDLYKGAINTRTKLVLLTHASNLTGQIYPVKRIAAIAHQAGAEVLVDGAQTFAILDYKIPDLDCDYYGMSLHKWLMAPVGSGVLWMRKQHQPKIWPLVPPPAFVKGMERFMWCGTYPEYITAAVAPAVEFHEKLGTRRKEERIKYLSKYWRDKLAKQPGVKFYTADDPDASCGLGVFEIENVDSEKLQKHLWERHKVLVQHMSAPDRDNKLNGIRVSPNVYTTPAELDRFVALVADAVKTGLK